MNYGVPIYPGDDWKAAFASRPAGSTFLAKAGQHPLTAPVTVPSFTTINADPGTVLDGGGITNPGLFGTGKANVGVVVRGLEVVGFTVGIHPGHGWQLEDVDVHNCGKGVQLNTGLRVYGGRFSYCASYGITGSGIDWLVLGAEIDHCGAGSKISHFSDGAFIGCDTHDNLGPGLWSDGDCKTDYLRNHCHDNGGPGIDHELSEAGFTIAYNVCEGNASAATGKSAWYGGQIMAVEASNGEIADNIVRDTLGTNGIVLRNDNRAVVPVNITVHDNDVSMATGGQTGMIGTFDQTTTWGANRYHVSDPAAEWFAAEGSLAWAEWQALGLDTDGSIGQ